jgi:3-hydroxybutyryl-CoA dehydrogenase
MSASPLPKVVVIGAGTMGHGIAQVAAVAGHPVTLVDAAPAALERALAKVGQSLDKLVEKGKLGAEAAADARARLGAAEGLEAAVADAGIVVEAIPENLAWKQALFARVDAAAPAGALLGTNTSSLSIGAIAGAVRDPGRVIGLHFFNPVPLMSLLEIVVHDAVSDDTRARALAFGAGLGKECIVVRDLPGFATSRLGVALGMEAIRMVEDGVASPEDIDKAMVLGYRHPVGPLRLTDMVGLDVRLAIGEHLAATLGNPAFSPPRLMREMVAAGKLGQKAGQGFYRW